MPRAPRDDRPGLIHHVFNRGVNRQTIFFDDRDRVEFGRLLGEIHEMFEVGIIAYCLMDNHYHLVIRCPEGGLSDSMQRLGSILTMHVNERQGRDGPLFRGRFGSLVVDSDEYLLTAVRYVHRNALALSGVDRVEDYRWSSHRSYVGLRQQPSFLDTSLVLDHFGSADAFHRFVAASDRARSRPPSVREVTSAVELAIVEATVGLEEDNQPWLGRVVSMLVADHLPTSVRLALLDDLGSPSDRSIRRTRQRARSDEFVVRVAARTLDVLGIPARGRSVPGRPEGV